MTKKAASGVDEHDLTLEVTTLPVIESESESAALPVIETEVKTEVEAPSDEGTKDHQDVKVLELKIAELEDKFIKLQTELNTLINKKKKKKASKGKKVKCKCKDKKVELAKCKCKSKKLDN